MHLCAELIAVSMMLEPLGEVGANFSLQLSLRTQFTKINNKKVIAENQCEKHKKSSLTPSYIGSELTCKGVCEQAKHVMSPQGIRRMMKTRTNQPMQKYRCSYKAFKWSKHSQKLKLWVFLQYEDRDMYYSDS